MKPNGMEMIEPSETMPPNDGVEKGDAKVLNRRELLAAALIAAAGGVGCAALGKNRRKPQGTPEPVEPPSKTITFSYSFDRDGILQIDEISENPADIRLQVFQEEGSQPTVIATFPNGKRVPVTLNGLGNTGSIRLDLNESGKINAEVTNTATATTSAQW